MCALMRDSRRCPPRRLEMPVPDESDGDPDERWVTPGGRALHQAYHAGSFGYCGASRERVGRLPDGRVVRASLRRRIVEMLQGSSAHGAGCTVTIAP